MGALSGYVALVTGATAGFGAEIARVFHAEGAAVILTGRRQSRLDEMAAELGERVHTLCFDVQDRHAIDSALESLPDEFQAIHILVNNAGLALGVEPAWATNLDDWQTMIQTNCWGAVAMTRAVLPGMVARNRGHIVNISSIAGVYSYAGGNVYGATKAFLTQFSLNLRADLVGHNVRVTDIQPGAAETEFSIVRHKGNTAAADRTYAGMDPLVAADIAETVRWCVTLPEHVCISRLEVMPTMQAPAGLKIVRTAAS